MNRILSLQFMCFSLIICFFIEHNYADTKVFYEFRIREKESNENDTSVSKEDKKQEPELLITGTRTASHLILAKEPNATNSVYRESVIYTADDTGYHVDFNISIDPLGVGPRLNAKTLKVALG